MLSLVFNVAEPTVGICILSIIQNDTNGLLGAWEQPPRGAPGYQILSDILFRLGLIANCSHTVQYLDCSDLNWRCNHYHLFWHCMTLLVLVCRKTVIPPPPPMASSRTFLSAASWAGDSRSLRMSSSDPSRATSKPVALKEKATTSSLTASQAWETQFMTSFRVAGLRFPCGVRRSLCLQVFRASLICCLNGVSDIKV